MTLGPNESSWVGQRAQEMLGILEAEYTRPSVLFKPSLKNRVIGWRVTYGEFTAVGSSPDEAMREFDRLWVKKSQ